MDIDEFKESLNRLAQVAQESMKILVSASTAVNTDQISDTLSALADGISGILPDNNLQNFSAALDILVTQLTAIYGTPLANVPSDPVVTIPEETIASIQSALPCLEEEGQTTCREFIQSHSLEIDKRELTLSNAIALIGLFLTIIFGILQMLPDKQLDEIIEQGDTLIAQNEIIIQQQAELVSILHDLENGLHLLTDVVDSIRDENEDIDDFPEIQGYANPDNTQQQNAD